MKAYRLHWKVLNAEDFGVPQHRPRLFIVGLDRSWSGRGFRFPSASGRTDLEYVLLPRQSRPSSRDAPPTCTSADNLKEAIADLKSKGHKPLDEPWVVNVDAARGRAHVMLNRCPCLTRFAILV